MKHLDERIELEKKYGNKKLLIPTLDGKEREYLREQGYQFKSEGDHCVISWN